ncbi:hypothetical protein CR513_47936, partial [Mucuna pruriens]
MVRLVMALVGEPATSISTLLYYSGLLPHNVTLLRLDILETISKGGNFQFNHTLREENAIADFLAKPGAPLTHANLHEKVYIVLPRSKY